MWRINLLFTLKKFHGGGYVLGGLYVDASLTAHSTCCMDKYVRPYRYVSVIGAGFGFKLHSAIPAKNDHKWFSTPCIPWPDHGGWGSVDTSGAGFIRGYGFITAVTPQTYFHYRGFLETFELSVFVKTKGFWFIPFGG